MKAESKKKSLLKHEILDLIRVNPGNSSTEIVDNLVTEASLATVKRYLNDLISEGLIETTGKRKGTRYWISESYKLLIPIDPEKYFSSEQDERDVLENFNFTLLDETLGQTELFTKDEKGYLDGLQSLFRKSISSLTDHEIRLALERLAIDLSWKSSQIEGNTYSLLETEQLLKEKVTVSGKTREEASMLLNHKKALDFILENPGYVDPLTISSIEDIHSILIKDLGVNRNLRTRGVGITGTNYAPPDNEHQIREAIEKMCVLVNENSNVYEKALLILLLISYIQPFVDGNKRTARIISNAILIANEHCPLSFRSVNSIEYKKAMLLFYEQNNITAFKNIFISQYEFAVNTYFNL